MKVHVICCNNIPQAAVIEGEVAVNAEAEAKLKELRDAHYVETKDIFSSEVEYLNRCHWCIKTVEGFV